MQNMALRSQIIQELSYDCGPPGGLIEESRGAKHFLMFLMMGTSMCTQALADTFGDPDVPVRRLGTFKLEPLQRQAIEAVIKTLWEKRVAQIELVDRCVLGIRPSSLGEAVYSGKLDWALVPISELVPFIPELRIFDIPFLFADRDHVSNVQEHLMNELAAPGL